MISLRGAMTWSFTHSEFIIVTESKKPIWLYQQKNWALLSARLNSKFRFEIAASKPLRLTVSAIC